MKNSSLDSIQLAPYFNSEDRWIILLSQSKFLGLPVRSLMSNISMEGLIYYTWEFRSMKRTGFPAGYSAYLSKVAPHECNAGSKLLQDSQTLMMPNFRLLYIVIHWGKGWSLKNRSLVVSQRGASAKRYFKLG